MTALAICIPLRVQDVPTVRRSYSQMPGAVPAQVRWRLHHTARGVLGTGCRIEYPARDSDTFAAPGPAVGRSASLGL